MDRSGTTPSTEALFHLELQWFMTHLATLAETPERACRMAGHHDVAHELWYALPRCGYVLQDPLRLMPNPTRIAVQRLVASVSAVPEPARAWATSEADALARMRDDAWGPARRQARALLAQLEPIAAMKDAYFARVRSTATPD